MTIASSTNAALQLRVGFREHDALDAPLISSIGRDQHLLLRLGHRAAHARDRPAIRDRRVVFDARADL